MKDRDWQSLRTGDYVRFGPARTLRKVLFARRILDKGVIAIRLMKLHSSWTAAPYTVYCRGDRELFEKVRA